MRRSPGAALQAVLRYSAHSAGRSASPGSISPAEAGRRPGNGLAAAGHGGRAPAGRRGHGAAEQSAELPRFWLGVGGVAHRDLGQQAAAVNKVRSGWTVSIGVTSVLAH